MDTNTGQACASTRSFRQKRVGHRRLIQCGIEAMSLFAFKSFSSNKKKVSKVQPPTSYVADNVAFAKTSIIVGYISDGGGGGGIGIGMTITVH